MNETWHKYLTEAFATFGLVFVAAGAVLANGVTGGLGVTGVALASGLVLVAMMYAAHHLSGAHLNPAVTVAMWATGHMKSGVAVGYVLSQLVGSVVAALLLRVLFSVASPGLSLGGVALGGGTTPGMGILVEALLTFLFVYTYFATVVDRKENGGHAGLALGFLWAASIFVGWHLSGAALNPARAFGPALISQMWTDHYVYWVGPLLGGLVAGFVYHFTYLSKRAG